MNKIKVRFAPSPTGIPHIGGTRTALFTYLFAKHNKGKFILRIEDTDRKRLIPGSEEAINEILSWLGLIPDEKFKQSDRLNIYKKHIDQLLGKKIAYKKDGAVYIHVPDDKEFSWVDLVGNKKISFNGKDIEDFVILKSDGFPTYHLASIVDDHLMEITHVTRGEEWASSTPKHLYLYEAFGWSPPYFAHLPVILGTDHTKLSKRHGAKSALDYRDEGYLPQALNNYTALLGWNPGGDKEIMNMDEMVSLFELKDINTSNPIFDINKLNWMNGEYIRQLSIDELSSNLKSQNSKLVELAQSRMTTLNDFNKLTGWMDKPSKISSGDKQIAINLYEELLKVKNWKNDEIFSAMKKFLEERQIKIKVLYKIFTGAESGLPLPQSLEILGKEKTLSRLKN